MSLWDTDPWSSFSDPRWELICRNKWHPGTSEISTTPEMAVGTLLHARNGTKTILVFLLADGEASWSLLPSSVSLLSGGTVESENTYSCILKVTSQVWESLKKDKQQHWSQLPPAFPKPVSTDLTKSDSVLTNPVGKDGVRLVDIIKYLPRKVFYLWYHH